MYYPGLLPVPGSDDLTLNVLQFRTTWQETLRIVDGMRNMPMYMSAPLKVSLDSLRFYVGTVLAKIDVFLRTGGSVRDDAFDIPSVHDPIELFQQELLRTKAHWDAWADGETASFAGVQQDPTREQALMEATKPPSNVESLIFLAGGALVIGALLLLKR